MNNAYNYLLYSVSVSLNSLKSLLLFFQSRTRKHSKEVSEILGKYESLAEDIAALVAEINEETNGKEGD